MVAQQNFRVDSFVGGLFGKAPVKVATTANIVLSGEQTVNTVALLEGDRCLVKDQTNPIENGVYTVEQGAWNRAGDFDGNRDIVKGTMVMVELPSGAFELYQVTSSGNRVGQDAITIALFLTATSVLDLQAITAVGAITTLGIGILDLLMNEQAGGASPGAGKGRLYVKNTNPTEIWFIRDDDSTFKIGGGTGISSVVEDATPELGGNLGCLDKEVGRAILVDYGVKARTEVSVAGVLTLDLVDGNAFEVELFEDITSVVIQNPSPTGNYCELDIVFTQDGTGGWTVGGWPGGVKWPSGTAPTITTTPTTGEDEVHLSTRDAGTKWLGTFAQDFS